MPAIVYRRRLLGCGASRPVYAISRQRAWARHRL